MKRNNLVVGLLAFFFICYFVFPVIFFLPLNLIYPEPMPAEVLQKVELFFLPVTFLAAQIPLYKAFLFAQIRFLPQPSPTRSP